VGREEPYRSFDWRHNKTIFYGALTPARGILAVELSQRVTPIGNGTPENNKNTKLLPSGRNAFFASANHPRVTAAR
jgi:hypothetical protein